MYGKKKWKRRGEKGLRCGKVAVCELELYDKLDYVALYNYFGANLCLLNNDGSPTGSYFPSGSLVYCCCCISTTYLTTPTVAQCATGNSSGINTTFRYQLVQPLAMKGIRGLGWGMLPSSDLPCVFILRSWKWVRQNWKPQPFWIAGIV